MKRFGFIGILGMLVLGWANVGFGNVGSYTYTVNATYTTYMQGTIAPTLEVIFYLKEVPSTITATAIGEEMVEELKIVADKKASETLGFSAFPEGRWGIVNEDGEINHYAREENDIKIIFYYGAREQARARMIANTQRDFVGAAKILEDFYRKAGYHAANAARYYVYAGEFKKAKILLEEYLGILCKIDGGTPTEDSLIEEADRDPEGFYYGICLLETEGKRTELLTQYFARDYYFYEFCPEERKEEDRLFVKYFVPAAGRNKLYTNEEYKEPTLQPAK